MRVQVVDPSAFTPPYDHALCAALARAGADVELITSRFAYGSVAAPDGYALREQFYRHARGAAGGRVRSLTKLAEHVPDMLRYRTVARDADVVHFQWLDVQWLDRVLLPRRPLVLTAHDLLPREPRPGQVGAQRRLYDAVDSLGRPLRVRTRAARAGARPRSAQGSRDPPRGVRAPGAPGAAAAPGRIGSRDAGPVVLFFGLLRPYKGIDVLLQAWRELPAGAGAELWIVGRPRMDIDALLRRRAAGRRFVSRYVPDAELASFFRRADVVVLPYTRTDRFDQSGVLATALAFVTPMVLSDVGGFGEVAATGAGLLVPPGDAAALAGRAR